MGYRSEVVLAVHKQVMGKFLQLIGQHEDMKTLCFSDADVRENYKGDGNFLFRWSGIKWYDSFPEIEAIIDFMQWCHDTDIKDENHPEGRQISASEFFKFLRVGEESDDIERDGYCEEFEIYTCTSIEIY
jgi:hypothetical protein